MAPALIKIPTGRFLRRSRGRNGMAQRTIELIVDEVDFDAIQEAVARRQAIRVMPDADGNLMGRIISEICRGWVERCDAASTSDGDNYTW